MSWFVGQEVGVLREAGVFKVCSVEKEHLVLEDEIGFTYRYLKQDVVARQQINIDQITSKDFQVKITTAAKKIEVSKERNLPFIDLHSE